MSQEKKLIAVVDDSATDRSVAGLLIQREGFEPVLLDSFSELTRLLKSDRSRVCLIMLDINMPGLTGIDILKRLRRDAGIRGIPIIMLTGDSSSETVQTCILGGALDYIIKPIDPMIFESKLRSLLKLENDSHRNSWVEYRLTQVKEAKIHLQVPGVLLSVGELSLTIRSNHSFSPGSVFILDTTLFAEVGVGAVPLRIEACEHQAPGVGFNLHCSIVGLPESDLHKIRVFCRSLWQNAARAA